MTRLELISVIAFGYLSAFVCFFIGIVAHDGGYDTLPQKGLFGNKVSTPTYIVIAFFWPILIIAGIIKFIIKIPKWIYIIYKDLQYVYKETRAFMKARK